MPAAESRIEISASGAEIGEGIARAVAAGLLQPIQIVVDEQGAEQKFTGLVGVGRQGVEGLPAPLVTGAVSCHADLSGRGMVGCDTGRRQQEAQASGWGSIVAIAIDHDGGRQGAAKQADKEEENEEQQKGKAARQCSSQGVR